jgi:hypothetical protein
MKENEDIKVVSEQIASKLDEINNNLSALSITCKRLLGKDAYDNEYYLFKDIQNKVFIKSKSTNEWSFYDSKEDIISFTDMLVEKGSKEKRLKFNLKKAIEKKILFDDKDATIYDGEEAVSDEVAMDLSSCAEIIINFEEKFTDYLKNYGKEWESISVRKQWVSV